MSDQPPRTAEAARDPASDRRGHRAGAVHEPGDDQSQRERVRPRFCVPAAELAGGEGARAHHLVAAPHQAAAARAAEERAALRGALRDHRDQRRRADRCTEPASGATQATAPSRNSRVPAAASRRTRAPWGIARFREPWPMGAPATIGMPRRPSRSASTVSASGALPSFSAQPTKSPTTTPASRSSAPGELELRQLAIDAIGALADLLEEQHGAVERQRPRRADEARQHLEVAADERPFEAAPRAAPQARAAPSAAAAATSTSASANSDATSSAGSLPSCVTTGPCSDATPARAAHACSAVTSEKPTMSLGARANAAASSRARMRISP